MNNIASKEWVKSLINKVIKKSAYQNLTDLVVDGDGGTLKDTDLVGAKTLYELNSNLTWKHYTTVSGSTQISYPTDWNEIIVTITAGDSTFVKNILPYMVPQSSFLQIADGFGYANKNYYTTFRLYDTYMCLEACILNSSDYTSSTSIIVYYK